MASDLRNFAVFVGDANDTSVLGEPKVVTKVWPLVAVGAAGTGCPHVPLVWLRHRMTDDVVRIMCNTEQAAQIHKVQSRSEKSGLLGACTDFSAFGCSLTLKVGCATTGGFRGWGEKKQFTYTLLAGGETVVPLHDAGYEKVKAADPLRELHEHVSVDGTREVAASFDAATGLSTSSKQVVQYQVTATLGDLTSTTWHRFSDFTLMHDMMLRCLDPEMVEANQTIEEFPKPPPKTWTSSSFSEGADFAEARRGMLTSYLQGVLAYMSGYATMNPYVLSLLGLLGRPSQARGSAHASPEPCD